MCNLYSSKDLLSSENNSTYCTTIITLKDGNKTEYALSDNSYTSFTHAKPHVHVFACLTLPYKLMYLVLKQ